MPRRHLKKIRKHLNSFETYPELFREVSDPKGIDRGPANPPGIPKREQQGLRIPRDSFKGFIGPLGSRDSEKSKNREPEGFIGSLSEGHSEGLIGDHG